MGMREGRRTRVSRSARTWTRIADKRPSDAAVATRREGHRSPRRGPGSPAPTLKPWNRSPRRLERKDLLGRRRELPAVSIIACHFLLHVLPKMHFSLHDSSMS
jgi:hypothetical protein